MTYRQFSLTSHYETPIKYILFTVHTHSCLTTNVLFAIPTAAIPLYNTIGLYIPVSHSFLFLSVLPAFYTHYRISSIILCYLSPVRWCSPWLSQYLLSDLYVSTSYIISSLIPILSSIIYIVSPVYTIYMFSPIFYICFSAIPYLHRVLQSYIYIIFSRWYKPITY